MIADAHEGLSSKADKGSGLLFPNPGMWGLATFVFSGTCVVQARSYVWYVLWLTRQVHHSELAVMLSDGNNSSPGTNYATSGSAASGVCV